MINGRWLAAYSNHEHEIIAEKLGSLPPEKVEALIAGLPTSFDDPRQQVIYELASALAQPRVVPMGLFRRAKALLGDAGINSCWAPHEVDKRAKKQHSDNPAREVNWDCPSFSPR